MKRIELGRTGLEVSAAGLGAGGFSQLGKKTGLAVGESVALVRRALDAGVNLVDTAECYGTEEILGKALAGVKRDSVVVCTKTFEPLMEVENPGEVLEKSLDGSLKRLGLDFVDVYFLHGLRAGQYDFAKKELLPVMLKMKEKGKLKHPGVTEAFESDRWHDMLKKAASDGCWGVIMCGFNILNQSARRTVLPAAIKNGVGVLDMFAVRKALTSREKLKPFIDGLVSRGLVDRTATGGDDPLGFLIKPGVAESLADAAYRFCRDEPGIHSVLFGTGSAEHLEANLASFERPALPAGMIEGLKGIFEKVEDISGG